MKARSWKLLLIGFLIIALMLIYTQMGRFLIAQIEETKNPTGYFVKVESINVPKDITNTPVGTFILYDKSGTMEIWRENIVLEAYKDDTQLETAIDYWAIPYISKYERKIALSNLLQTSQIVGQKIAHKQ
jgi:K+ transporter